ncbi:MAG: glycosyltransferase family 2 protein [Candidatus Thorarchaeota archaeon]|nr:glycosyltransferase family 2 protein [Candidatus Thorarchaeota archaeon]
MEKVVTVLIRVYNNSDTVKRAIESVIQQTIDSNIMNILVVDDGSKDDSLEIVKSFKNVEIIQTDHKGSISALNIGLKHVTTPYVIMLDSDDWFENSTLEKMLFEFQNNPEIDFVYSDYFEILNETRKIVSIGNNLFNTLAAGIMFSMALFKTHGYYDENLLFSEYDLLIRILPTAKGKYLPLPLYNYYRRKDSVSAGQSFFKRGTKELFEKYGQYFPIREY